ncbi:MAG: hypothetical protein HKL91_06170 [Candidatus Eremiobacteraeota bacterium]|nr:hypothetical protein [Candidatus Eremiobacteraeota bacterium]
MIASTALAYKIFADARTYWDKQLYPHRMNYSVRIAVRDKSGRRVESYRSVYDARNGRIWVDTVSDYERAHPAQGRGVDFCFMAISSMGVASPDGSRPMMPRCGPPLAPAPNQDFIGVPILAPNYSFLLGNAGVGKLRGALDSAQIVRQIRREFHDPLRRPLPLQAGGSKLPVIADVVAYARRYVITLAGEDTIGTHRCYHLVLRPVQVSGSYRLRDLWIDTKTFATIRARIALNFVTGPGTHIPWTIDFADIRGARYITSERADAPYRYAGRVYDRVKIHFVNVQTRKKRMPFLLPFAAYLKLREPD